jgi:hypothetical protein
MISDNEYVEWLEKNGGPIPPHVRAQLLDSLEKNEASRLEGRKHLEAEWGDKFEENSARVLAVMERFLK